MKNPTWSRDELIVALDFYLKYRRQIPNKGDREIRELSDRLSTLGRILFGAPDTDTTERIRIFVGEAVRNFFPINRAPA